MAHNEDLFEARLRRLKQQPSSGDTRFAPKILSEEFASMQLAEPKRQHSYLLPIVSVAFLILGAVAFAIMLLMPDIAGGAIASMLDTEHPLR